jgi:hypothetical protein
MPILLPVMTLIRWRYPHIRCCRTILFSCYGQDLQKWKNLLQEWKNQNGPILMKLFKVAGTIDSPWRKRPEELKEIVHRACHFGRCWTIVPNKLLLLLLLRVSNNPKIYMLQLLIFPKHTPQKRNATFAAP